jgi:hypothetical protein
MSPVRLKRVAAEQVPTAAHVALNPPIIQSGAQRRERSAASRPAGSTEATLRESQPFSRG